MRVREVQSFRTGTLSYCRSLNAPTHPSSSEIVPSGLRVRVLQCHWSSIMSPMNQPLWFVSSEKMKPPKCEIHFFLQSMLRFQISVSPRSNRPLHCTSVAGWAKETISWFTAPLFEWNIHQSSARHPFNLMFAAAQMSRPGVTICLRWLVLCTPQPKIIYFFFIWILSYISDIKH